MQGGTVRTEPHVRAGLPRPVQLFQHLPVTELLIGNADVEQRLERLADGGEAVSGTAAVYCQAALSLRLLHQRLQPGEGGGELPIGGIDNVGLTAGRQG